jgi:superkiller protein 3
VWSTNIDFYQHAVRISPTDLDPLKNFGNILLNDGRTVEALAVFQRGIEIEERLDYRYALQRTLSDLGRHEESVVEGLRVVSESTDAKATLDANHVLGKSLLELNRPAEALAAFKNAAEQVQKFPARKRGFLMLDDVLMSYGAMLNQASQHAEAQVMLQQAIEINPLSASAFFNLANIQKAQKDFAGAVVQYGKALQLDPLLTPAWMNCANTLMASGRIGEAVQHYKAAHQLVPAEAGIHIAYLHAEGEALERDGELDAALRSYEKGAALFPEAKFAARVESVQNQLAADNLSQDDFDSL